MKHKFLLGFTLLSSISLSVCSSNVKFNIPFAKEIKHIDKDISHRVGPKTLEKLIPFIHDKKEEDAVYSPASLALAVAAVSAVSDNFDLNAFGIANAESDTKTFLENWNFEEKGDREFKKDTSFRSSVLHQAIGDAYAFDEAKQNKIADNYIASVNSTFNNYKKDAKDFFDDNVGLEMEIPDFSPSSDCVATYAALKMKDTVVNGLSTGKKDFNFKNGVEQVDAYCFGTKAFPDSVRYYAGSNYVTFGFNISYTDLVIVLPNDGVDVNDVNFAEAYSNYLDNAKNHHAYGYVPYFHNKTLGVDITNVINGVVSGNEKYMTKLIKDELVNDLILDKIIQSSDFEFDKNGVKDESITIVLNRGTAMEPTEEDLELNVNRPFYAISMMDDFPLFVNKISNPGK